MIVIKYCLTSFVVAIGSSACFAATTVNLSASLADTRNILAGGGQADVVVLGDSLSFRDGNYLPELRSLLQQHYGNAGAGYQGHSLWSGGGFNPGWSNGQINQDTAPYRSLDGLWSSSTAAPYPPTHTSAYFDTLNPTVELQYLAQPGGGSFAIYKPNGQVITIDTESPVSELRAYTYTPGGRPWIQPQGDGEIVILGQNNVTADPGVRLHRAANGGWGVNNFIHRDWTFDAQLNALDTDLVMVLLGQNDQGYNRTTYANQLNLLVDRLKSSKPDAEIVLISTINNGSTVIPNLSLAMEDVANSRGVGFIDLYSLAGPMWGRGYLDPDGVHFGLDGVGGKYVANILYNQLVPEPASAALLIVGSIVGLRRRRR